MGGGAPEGVVGGAGGDQSSDPAGGGHRRLLGPARLRRHRLLPLKPERARWPTAAHHPAAGPPPTAQHPRGPARRSASPRRRRSRRQQHHDNQLLLLGLAAVGGTVWDPPVPPAAGLGPDPVAGALRYWLPPELDALHHRDFEYAIRDLVLRDGCTDARQIGGAGDNSADVLATDPLGRSWVIQVSTAATETAAPRSAPPTSSASTAPPASCMAPASSWS